MHESNARSLNKETRIRRKKLLRMYREDQQAMIWNKVVDEVGGVTTEDLDRDCYTFDFLDREPDPDFAGLDEPYPNETETMHNLFDC